MKRILVVDDEPELLEVLREIPVIMVTANAENAIAAECIRQGAFGYVPKPFNLMYMDHMAAVATEQAGPRRR